MALLPKTKVVEVQLYTGIAVYFYDPDGNMFELIQSQDDIEDIKAQKYELAACKLKGSCCSGY